MIAVIDLGGTRTKFGLVDRGTVVASASCEAASRGSIRTHLDEVAGRLEKLLAARGLSFDGCGGIGISSTGIVDSARARVLTTNGKYDDAVGFDFAAWGRERAGLEVRIENDARAALIGEWRYGAGRGRDDLFMVTLGTGIGTAAIMAGRPLIGPGFAGGNLGGHIIVRSGGRPCTCGAHGCLETEASGWVLPMLIAEHPQLASSPLQSHAKPGFKEVMEYAETGDACARGILDHCLRIWGEAIVSFVHLLGPARVIVGGGLMNNPAPLLASFRETLRENGWGALKEVEIVAAENPDNAGIIGAAALFYGSEDNISRTAEKQNT
ncbi:MAG: ROK family protein [Chthoniobacterales bacterium]